MMNLMIMLDKIKCNDDNVIVNKNIYDANLYKKDVFHNNECSLYLEKTKFFRLFDNMYDKHLYMMCINKTSNKETIVYHDCCKIGNTYINHNPFFMKNHFLIDISYVYNNKHDKSLLVETSTLKGIRMVNINIKTLSFNNAIFFN